MGWGVKMQSVALDHRLLAALNGTLIRTGACRKELRGRLFSPFLEEYGGDSPRRKAEKLPDRP